MTGLRPWILVNKETVGGLLLAAEERYDDAVGAFCEGRGWAAVYLLGYTAEMLLKHAAYRLKAAPRNPAAHLADGYLAAFRSQTTLISGLRFGNGHSLSYWGEAVLDLRNAGGYASLPGGDSAFLNRLADLQDDWTETMRYHAGAVSPIRPQPEQFILDVDWLRVNKHLLWR